MSARLADQTTGIQMRNKYAIPFALICLLAIYAFGFFGWRYMPNVAILNNIYYISVASTIYGMSIVIFITAINKLIKIISCLWLGVSSAALYNEIFLDPTNWTWWSAGLVIFVSLNLLLTVSIVEKIKSKNDSSNNNI